MVTTANSINNNAPPIGSLQYLSLGGTDTTYPNQNWLLCDGSIVSQATYTTLFSRVGLINGAATVWTRQTPYSANTVVSVAYGNSTYVDATGTGVIYTSTNGSVWTLQTSGTTSTINSITYGTVFAYVTNNGGLSTSTDGVTWTSRTSGTGSTIQTISYLNGIYIFGGSGPSGISTSTDAITWVANKIPFASSVTSIAYGGGKYAALTSLNQITTSTDGTTWESITPAIGIFGQTGRVVVNNAGFLVGVAGQGNIVTSTNASRWIARVSGTTSNFYATTYGGNYVVGGAGGLIESSTDGITWTARTSNTTSSILALAFGNSTYVYGAASGGGGTSTDGTTWVAHNTGSASNVNSITYGSVFVYGLNGGAIFTSTDGITFTSRTSNTSSIINTVIFGNNLYVYGTVNGGIGTSTDGITWTARTSGTTSAIQSITYGTIYVATLSGNGATSLNIITSTDAITWSLRNSSFQTGTFYSVFYNSPTYYAAGSNASSSTGGYISTSTDGITWTQVGIVPNTLSALVYGNKFVGVGPAGAINTSTDALTWTYVPVTNTNVAVTISAIIYANSKYVAVGSAVAGSNVQSTIVTSTDGNSWYLTKNPGITNLTTLVYGTQYVAQGSTTETLISSGTYSYNSVTSFQLPNDQGTQLTDEAGNNYIKKLYIKAL